MVSVVVARALDPAQFAFYLVLLAVAILAAGLWDAGVSTVLVRTVSEDHTAVVPTIRRALRLRVLTFPAWLTAVGIGFTSSGGLEADAMATAALFSLMSLVAGTSVLPLAALRGRLRFGLAAAAQSAGRWTAATLVLGAVLAGTDGLLTLVAAAHVVGESVTLVAAWWGVSRMGTSPGQRTGDVRLRAALPYAANGLLNLAYNRFDVILVGLLTSPGELARYAPASRIQDALYLISGTTYVVAVPMLSRLANSRAHVSQTRIQLRRFWLLGGGIGLGGAIVVFAFAEEIIGLVLGPGYLGSVVAVRIIVWSMPLSIVGAPLLAVLVAHGRGADTTRAFLAAFVTSLVLHASLDWWLGAVGASIASVARDAANAAVAGFLTRPILRTSEPTGQPAVRSGVD